MSGDHVERLDAFANHWQAAMDDDLVSEVIAVIDGRPLRESDLRAALYELERLRAQLTAPDGICGTTFGVEQAPMFICTLPRGHFPDGMHKNAGGTAWLLDSGVWTIQRGPAWVARLHDEDPQQPERDGAE